MSPEKQRIAIAEACGFTKGLTRLEDAFFDRSMSRVALPEYLEDLNAMHEAEKVLTDEQIFPWWNNLSRIVGRDCKRPANCYSKDLRPVMATAAQRAEAFLKTLNLWTE